MNGDFKIIYDKLVEVDTTMQVFHAENKKDFKTLFDLKEKVDGLECNVHSERLLWLVGSVRILWGVIIVGGVIGVSIKLYFGVL